jgi:hypothetical protein
MFGKVAYELENVNAPLDEYPELEVHEGELVTVKF